MISTDGDLVTPGKGCPHPGSHGAFPRVLARYVRERHLLSLEAAIAKMTSAPARMIGLADRGVLAVGKAADVVVFDPEKIGDRATFTDPHHYSEGVQYLFINGAVAIDSGRLTNSRSGIALRRPR